MLGVVRGQRQRIDEDVATFRRRTDPGERIEVDVEPFVEDGPRVQILAMQSFNYSARLTPS
jgi:hypothetical protein